MTEKCIYIVLPINIKVCEHFISTKQITYIEIIKIIHLDIVLSKMHHCSNYFPITFLGLHQFDAIQASIKY